MDKATAGTPLGIYPDKGALDHDVAMLIDEALRELTANRGVDYDVALAAVRRAARRSR